MKNTTLLLILIICALAVGCQRSEFGATLSPSTVPDAAKASIDVNDDNSVADGLTPTPIYIWIMNYQNKPLANIQVSITVSGTGNTIIPCTLTDANGKATCGLITTMAEPKIVTIVGTTKSDMAKFKAPKEVKDGGMFVAVGDAQLTSAGATIATSVDSVGSFVGQDLNHITRIRSSILGSLFAEIP